MSDADREALLKLDPELAVALDVLNERFSPVKPYEYRWEVGWAETEETREVDSWLSISLVTAGADAATNVPPLHAGEDWATAVARVFGMLEAEPWRRLFEAYANWHARMHGRIVINVETDDPDRFAVRVREAVRRSAPRQRGPGWGLL